MSCAFYMRILKIFYKISESTGGIMDDSEEKSR